MVFFLPIRARRWRGNSSLTTVTMKRMPELAAVVALAAGATLAGCSRPQPKAAGPAEPVTIAYVALPQAGLAQVAQARGFFREEGLEVTARLHPYGKAALQELEAGTADFATAALTGVLFSILKGNKLAIVAAIQTSSQAHFIVARRDRGIGTLEHLKGKRVGVSLGTTSHFFLDAILVAHGLDRKGMQFVNLQPQDVPESLARGDIDAASTFTPYAHAAQAKLGDRGITLRDKNVYRYNFVVVARQELVRSDAGKVKKLLQGLIKAEGFVRDHLEEAQADVAAFCKVDVGVVRDSWGEASLAVTLDPSLILGLEEEARWAIRNGLTGAREVPRFADFIDLDGLRSVKPEAVRILE